MQQPPVLQRLTADGLLGGGRRTDHLLPFSTPPSPQDPAPTARLASLEALETLTAPATILGNSRIFSIAMVTKPG